MNYRRWARVAEWSLVAIVVALHAAILLWPNQRNSGPLIKFLADTQPFVVTSLFTTWIVLGPGGLASRAIPIFLLPSLLLGWILNGESSLSILNRAHANDPWALAFALTGFSVATVIRIFGLRVMSVPSNQAEPRLQFSIRAMLIATTLIAVTFGCLEMLRSRVIAVAPNTPYSDLFLQFEQLKESKTPFPIRIVNSFIPGPTGTRQWILCLAMAGSALGAIWTMLRPGAVWLRLAVLTLVLPTLAVYLTHLAGASGQTLYDRSFELAVAFAAVAGLTAISVLPLRLMGLRLCRPATCRPSLREGQASRELMAQRTAFSCQSTSPPSLADTECGPTLS